MRRDFQRTKVNKAIRETFLGSSPFEYSTHNQIYCNELLKKSWFSNMFPEIKSISTYPGRMRTGWSAYRKGDNIRIEFSGGPRQEYSILYAIAFGITEGTGGHSIEFCMTYLYLIKNAIGPKICGDLVRNFRKYNVKYGPSDAPIEETLWKYRTVGAKIGTKPKNSKPEDKYKTGFESAIQKVLHIIVDNRFPSPEGIRIANEIKQLRSHRNE